MLTYTLLFSQTQNERKTKNVAKNDTPVVENTAEAPTEPAAETPAKPKQKRNLLLVSMSVPQSMKDILDKIAADENTTVAFVARQRLAQALNIELPTEVKRARAKKYASKEDRVAAQTQKRNTASALLAALEAGELDADLSAILAKFAPKPRAKKGEGVAVSEPASATA